MRWIVINVLLLAGCGPGEAAVRLTVDGQAPGAAYLQVVATIDGASSQPGVVELRAGLPVTVQLRFPRERHGSAVLHVEAMTGAGAEVAAGGAVADVLPSEETAVRVMLSMADVPDGGADAATVDLAPQFDLVPPPDAPACTPRMYFGIPCGCYGLPCCQILDEWDSCNTGFTCTVVCPGAPDDCKRCF